MNNVSKEKGEKFESIVEKIYIQIANNERIKAKVEKHVPIIGDDGASHEIDILYSYEHFGVNYKVAIECKNWKNPINVGELRNFSGSIIFFCWFTSPYFTRFHPALQVPPAITFKCKFYPIFMHDFFMINRV